MCVIFFASMHISWLDISINNIAEFVSTIISDWKSRFDCMKTILRLVPRPTQRGRQAYWERSPDLPGAVARSPGSVRQAFWLLSGVNSIGLGPWAWGLAPWALRLGPRALGLGPWASGHWAKAGPWSIMENSKL